jgi:mono/diheme cytochrome c family protein
VRTLAHVAAALGLSALLAGCGQEPAPGAAAGGVDVWTFRADTAPLEFAADATFADRMPAEPGRTILVPATELFPGTVRIDPGIENPLAGNAEAVAAGERHFAAFNCDGCHAPLGGGGMAPSLSDGVWIYGGEPAQIFLSIMHGRPDGMPAWASMLPARTVWELVAYILSLPEIDDYAAARGFEYRERNRMQAPGEGGR